MLEFLATSGALVASARAVAVNAGEELKVLVSSRGPRRVGRYLLCDQIGFGGMATIHLARLLGPQGFSRTVAIKQLHPQFAQNPRFVAMLLDEARMAVRVRHVNVISPLDIVSTESELFIVMDYVNGESLANLLVASEGPLRPPIAAAILVQALLGLHAAHEATREQGEALGLVHRDVSPQNILVGQDGVARMLDFGIAKAVARTQTTDGGMVKGKLGYMAPEQIRLQPVDRRADLFSAGVVLWEALTGSGLFVADTLAASIELILHGEIAPPSQLNPAVTPELDAVVLKALERDREARFQDAITMAAALERATPLAGALEVIDWLERLAGPGLARKAELVRRAEATRWEPLLAMAPTLTETSAPPRLLGLRTDWSNTVPVSSGRDSLPRGTPTLTGLARPPEVRFAVGEVVPTIESTGVAVGGDRDASPTTEEKGGRTWKSLGLALGIVLAGSLAALGVLSLSRNERDSSSAVARAPVGAPPALALAVAAPPLEAPGSGADQGPPAPDPLPLSGPQIRPVASLAAVASVPDQPMLTRAGSSADISPRPRTKAARPASSVPLGALAQTSASSRAAAPARRSAGGKASLSASKAASKPTRNASGRVAGKTRSSNDHCTPPWTIDAQGIKVFKAECVR